MKKLYRITVETKYVERKLLALSVSPEDAVDENQSWIIHVGGKVVKVEEVEVS